MNSEAVLILGLINHRRGTTTKNSSPETISNTDLVIYFLPHPRILPNVIKMKSKQVYSANVTWHTRIFDFAKKPLSDHTNKRYITDINGPIIKVIIVNVLKKPVRDSP
jgi:hypothetical protein